MIFESISSPICILKVILTKVPFRKDDTSPTSRFSSSTLVASGGDISIILPSIEESEVALEPII